MLDIFEFIARDKPIAAAKWVENVECKCNSLRQYRTSASRDPSSARVFVAVLSGATSSSPAQSTAESKLRASFLATATSEHSSGLWLYQKRFYLPFALSISILTDVWLLGQLASRPQRSAHQRKLKWFFVKGLIAVTVGRAEYE